LNPVTYDNLARRARHLGNLPAMPIILSTLTDALSVNASKVDVDKIVETISYDKSLAAQCLRMANSALYRQRGDVAQVRDAVLTLGLWRIRDLAFSCNLPLMFSNLNCVVPKEFFWRHSLATAYIAEKLATEFLGSKNQQVYLAGLLHDIGILINALLFPDDFHLIMQEAVHERSSVFAIEKRILGFTHAESGRVLADLWRLPIEVAEVIEFHHCPEMQSTTNEITKIVNVASQLCWKSGLGYGYSLVDEALSSTENVLRQLSEKYPQANLRQSEDYAPILEVHIAAAQALADQVFGVEPVHI
jgi:putative nucleotidyltransferase with HDIG domain